MPVQTSVSAAANSARGAKEQIPTLSRCVNPDGISWRAIWYFPTSAASFPICSYCYDQHIQFTPHAGLFEAAWVDGNLGLMCQWNTPRVMSHLVANDWDAINAFMVERVKIPACKGLAGHTGPDGSRWHGMTGEWEIQGFVICEACYHDLVAWSQLKRYFTTTPMIKSDEGMWTCDAAVPVIKEGLRRATTSPNGWDDLHLLFRRRMEYPSCMEMKNLQAGSTHWYGSKAVPDLIVCTACYLDHFVLDHAELWELLSLTAEQQQQQLDCAMQTVQIYFAWVSCKRVSIANNTDEYDGFEDLARIILKSPPCSTDDMRNTTWYTPQDCTGDAFAICKRCFLAFMVAPGFVTEFKEVNFRRNGNLVCDLNPATPRCLKYLAKYEEAVKQENFSIFSDFVSEYAALPDCPRDKPYKNRKWYGKGGFTACEFCYKEAVEGASLASRLDCAVVPNEARCQMYSPRMRNLWQHACENNDLDSFLVLAKERMHVFLLMNMEKQRVEFGQLMRMQQRQTLMLASTINKGSESFASVVGNSGGAMFGNASIGFNWNSAAGAESHQQFLQAMGINVVQAGDGAALMPLMQRWAQLE
ncbi:hypothetical protein Asppvi_010876 [Aspergillus pseudoviridinutans]|uniref:Integral membrane protein n=1 Tax=Aspergillus pseudoviridinutans TaxID=1517512 RepID=A0A9P3EXF6_9EURO|nr:uncharacterized protein Asppvi_010876 [Aspergillus pseudoviridinutans]GIJ91901.1 hypothetical protein Asppvi_010876 [Aspergillus pseudoviridinutans]